MGIKEQLPRGMRMKVLYIDDLRDLDDGILVTLKGWTFGKNTGNPQTSTHVMGFDTVEEIIHRMSWDTYKCKCAECTGKG